VISFFRNGGDTVGAVVASRTKNLRMQDGDVASGNLAELND